MKLDVRKVSGASSKHLSANKFSTIERNQEKQLRHNVKASLVDGAAYGVMVGLGETYLPAFVLAIGLGEFFAGLVSSLPLVAGGLMQLASPIAVQFLGSHRRWVVLCAIVQASSFIPLIRAAIIGNISIPFVLLIAAVYWGAGLATGPAWNTWIGTIIPCNIRPQFFAQRTRISQVGVFFGLLFGGLLLQYATVNGIGLYAYAILFLFAGISRLVSANALRIQTEPIPLPKDMRKIPWKKIFHHLHASSGGRLLVYLIAVQASVQIAGPFFTPFMLKKLGFAYSELVSLFSVAFLAKVIALPNWGVVAKKIGAKRLLWIGGTGIVPLSAGWLVSQELAWLIVLQLFGGVFWAAYELAFFLLFFESIPEEERTSVLTIYNLLNTLAWVTGSLIGGALLFNFNASFYGYLLIFAISSIARLATLILLIKVPRIIVDSDDMGVRTVAVRPGTATLDTPVLPSLPDQVHNDQD